MKKIIVLIFFIFILPESGFLQNARNIDSLRRELKTFQIRKTHMGQDPSSLTDSTTANILDGLALEYLNFNLDSAMIFAREEFLLSENTGFRKGIANACISMGKILHTQGDLNQAMEYYQKSLKISEDIGYTKGIGNIRLSIGTIYYNEDVYPEALTNFNISLKIFTETRDKVGMARAYWNIGTVYAAQRKFLSALNFITTGLKIFESQGMKESIANSYYSLGTITMLMGNYSESLNYCFTALKFRESTLKNTDGVADIYLLIGQVYEKKGQLQEAFSYESKGLSMVQATGNKVLLRKAYANLASVFYRLGKYQTAYDHEVLYQQLDDSLYSRESSAGWRQCRCSMNLIKKHRPIAYSV